MKKVVVFGGSGFLGSHVADALSDRGYKVTVFDLNPSPFLRQDQEMVLGNILDKNDVIKVCHGADYVYNFAGLADINEAKEKPVQTAELNIIGNLNILEGARLAQVRRFVYASTVYVYSSSGSFYRASKQACENFVELFFEKYGLPFTILRYGSLYGRRSDLRNTIHRFIYTALTEGELRYQGTGEELREYIHAVDAATASVQALDAAFENQHFVITGSQVSRVKDVMMMISEMLENKIKLTCENLGLEAHYNITPYTFKPKLGKKLVVNPYVDMGQGLLDCIHEISDKLLPNTAHQEDPLHDNV